jgi:hypothetical protein
MNPRNPFYILELTASATPGEIERQGRKLLGLFELGVAKATKYTCPLGTFERDATMVREAMAALRDPNTRTKDAFVVGLLEDVPDAETFYPDAPLADSFAAGGYRGL